MARRWQQALAAQPALRQCLPTGATPQPAYAAVADLVAAGLASFARSIVFGLDEFGGLPADHPARCDRMLRQTLIAGIDLPDGSWRRLDPEAPDLGAECRRFAEEVAAGGLDLCVLGLGANGHLGLNEPGSPADAPTRRVELAPETVQSAARYGDGSVTPSWGLTLGMAEILAADQVWLLVTGASKAAVLARALEGPVGPAVPASFLQEHPACLVLADEAAASGLSRSR